MRLFLILLLLMCAPLAWTQEAEDSDAAQPDAAEPAEDAATEAEEDADAGDVLDELYPLEDDDEFIPSEDVAFGQSIPFPTDI